MATHVGYGQAVDTDSLLAVGLAYYKQQAFAKAIKAGELGILSAPTYYDFHMLLGRSLRRMGERQKALGYFEQVMQEAPVYRAAFMNAISIHFKDREFEMALTCVDDALEHHPDDKASIWRSSKFYRYRGMKVPWMIIWMPWRHVFPGTGV